MGLSSLPEGFSTFCVCYLSSNLSGSEIKFAGTGCRKSVTPFDMDRIRVSAVSGTG